MSSDFRVGRKGQFRSARVAAATAIASAAFVWSAGAQAYDLKKAPGGVDVRWYDSNVTFHLDASITGVTSGATEAITAAAQGWSGLEGAPALTVREGGGGAKPGYDGLNTVYYAPKGSSLTGGALAVTVFTYDSHGHALDVDIVVNGKYSFAVLPADATAAPGVKPVSTEGASNASCATPFDLHHVLSHEFGHTLGMADETTDTSALMFLYTSPGAASPRAPESDDAAGISSLYDAPSTPAAGGCSGSTVSPRGPSHEASRIALVVALGLVAGIVLRRRAGSAGKSVALGALLLAATTALPSERTARSAPSVAPLSSARAHVTHTETTVDASGLFTTRATLSTTSCRVARCPSEAVVTTFGGVMGDVHQDVSGNVAPVEGDDVEVAIDEALSATDLPAMRIVSR